MKYNFLDQELWRFTDQVAEYYKNSGYAIVVEQPISDEYRFRPTILAHKKGASSVAIEVRSLADVPKYFLDFVIDCERNREPIFIYIAIPSDNENDPANISLQTNKVLKDVGVGLLTNDIHNIVELKRARDQALRYKLQKGARMGKYHDRVTKAIEKFNEGLPIDAIRDITELFEEVIRDLAKKSARKGKINIDLADVTTIDLENLIDCLSTNNYKGSPQTKFFERTLSLDLKSFKGARNLSHHPRSNSQLRALNSQLYERMEMGIRLIREMQRVSRRV